MTPLTRGTTNNAKLPANLVRHQEQHMHKVSKAETRLPFPVAYIRRSKRQENDSVQRQQDRAQEYCRRVFGTDVKEFYIDKGKSGEFRNRVELNRLKEEAKSGRITAVIVEELDRMGRNMALIAVACEYFSDCGAVVHSISKNAAVEKVDVAMKGFMAEEFQVLLRARTAAGVKSVHNDERITTRAFGYERVADQPGERQINKRECAAIQWMFKARLEGMSFADIGRALDGYSPPLRKTRFSINAVRYILTNSLYTGVYVYGRNKCTRDKDTDKQIRTPAHHSDWYVIRLPHLQIIPMELFDAVDATMRPRAKAPRTETFLSGKVTMGVEQLPAKYAFDEHAFQKNNRTSEGMRFIDCDWLSGLVLDSLRTLLENDELERHFQRSLSEAFNKRAESMLSQRELLEESLEKVERKMEAAFDKRISSDFSAQFVEKRVRELSAEYEALRFQLTSLPLKPVPPVIDEGRRVKLREAFGGVIERLRASHYRPKLLSVGDLQIAHTIRGMIRNIDCQNIPGSRSIRCTVSFRLDKVFGVMCSSAEATAAVHTFSKVKHFTTQDELDGFREALRERRHALTDDEFDVIVAEHKDAISATLTPFQQTYLRRTLDRQMAVMTLSRYWRALRQCDPVQEDRLECVRLMRFLHRSGLWPALLQTIEVRFPARYQDLNLTLRDELTECVRK